MLAKILNQCVFRQSKDNIKLVHPLLKLTLLQTSVHVTPIRTYIFWSPDRKGGYMPEDNLTRTEKFKMGFGLLGKETRKLIQEFKDTFRYDTDPMLWDPFMIGQWEEHGTFQMVWKFRGEKDINDWVVTSDSDHGEGYSAATLSVSKQNNALFSGNLDTRIPKDGRVANAGYCNIRSPTNYKSFYRETPYLWHNFTHLIIRCRGDGRPYSLSLNMKRNLDIIWHDQYSFILYTRGGPYWQTAKIPFSKFFLTTKGRIQDKQNPLEKKHVSSMGITQFERNSGNFNLEIDYIAVVRDVNHKEEFWWEMYEIKTEMMY